MKVKTQIKAGKLAANHNIPGTWTLFVDGYEVHTKSDKFKLSVELDGKVVNIK